MKTRPGRSRRFSQRLFWYDFFISFKLGSFPLGAQSYASDLARRLREQNYTVFYSEEEAPPGQELDSTLTAALRRSRILIVLLNEGALLKSPWVRKEVEEFRRRHPKRPIIGVNIGGAIQRYGGEANISDWLGIDGRIWLEETIEAAKNGIANEEVLNRLVLAPTFLRANQLFSALVAVIMLILLSATAVALYQRSEANAARSVAETNERLAKQQRDQALSRESLFLAQKSREELAAGNPVSAVQLALRGLPRNNDRPFVPETLGALIESLNEQRELRTLRGPTKQSGDDHCSFSPDGARVLVASEDGDVRLWEARSGGEIGRLKTAQGKIASALFSPDGSRVLTVSDDKSASIWDAATARPMATMQGHLGAITSAVFSRDGTRVVTTSEDKTARMWDAATGREIAAFHGHSDRVGSAAFSPDGARALTVSNDGTARLWDTGSGAQKFVFASRSPVGWAQFTPDGAQVIATVVDPGKGATTPVIWDAATGAFVTSLPAFKEELNLGTFTTVGFSPDGRSFFAATADHAIRIWSAATWRQTAILRGHESWLTSIAFSPDGAMILTGSEDRTARLWNATTGQEVAVLRGPEDGVESVGFSADGSTILIAAKDDTVRLWDTATAQEITRLNGEVYEVSSAVMSPSGNRVLTVSHDHSIRLWDIDPSRKGYVLRGHEGNINAVDIRADSAQLLTASKDGTARLWDARDGRPRTVFRGHQDSVAIALFERNGTTVLTASDDKTARLWDATSGRQLQSTVIGAGQFTRIMAADFRDGRALALASVNIDSAELWDVGAKRRIAVLRGDFLVGSSAASFSPNGAYLVARWFRSAQLWDVSTGLVAGELVADLKDDEPTPDAAFSPDSKRVLVLTRSTGRVIEIPDLHEVAKLKGLPDSSNILAFSPSSAAVLTASPDNSVQVWETSSGRELFALSGHEVVFQASFSPDGSRIVTLSRDRTARIWDALTGQLIAVLRGKEDNSFLSMTFFPDGERLAFVSGDSSARIVWIGKNATDVISHARETLPRELTPAEERRFFLTSAH